jgi:enoyl-[acyl-carrier protein] reductase II
MVNRIQSLLGIDYPVVQAPMTYIARAELAAAVSEAGGLGMIETLTPDGRSASSAFASSLTSRRG